DSRVARNPQNDCLWSVACLVERQKELRARIVRQVGRSNTAYHPYNFVPILSATVLAVGLNEFPNRLSFRKEAAGELLVHYGDSFRFVSISLVERSAAQQRN